MVFAKITDILPKLWSAIMAGNSTGMMTTAVMETTPVAKDYLFTTMHDYHVTIGTLVIVIVVVILGIWIIVLNCLLIQTLHSCRAQLEVTDIFIYSLATTDMIIGVLLFYNTAYNVVNFQNRHECLIRFGLIQAMLMNSTGHIALLTINRYIKIIQPFKYNTIFKKWRIIFLSLGVWLFSLLFGFLPLMGWNKEYTPTSEDESHLVCRYFGVMHPAFIALNVSFYWIPLILMIVLYSHVFKIVCRHSREIIAQERTVVGKVVGIFENRSWRFTKTVFIIIGVYFFCWLPTGIYFMVQLTGSLAHMNYTTQGDILNYTTCVGFLNSLLNPIIYATKIPCVKHRFKKVFCCKDERRASIHTSTIFSTNNLNHLTELSNRNKET